MVHWYNNSQFIISLDNCMNSLKIIICIRLQIFWSLDIKFAQLILVFGRLLSVRTIIHLYLFRNDDIDDIDDKTLIIPGKFNIYFFNKRLFCVFHLFVIFMISQFKRPDIKFKHTLHILKQCIGKLKLFPKFWTESGT